MGRRKKKQRHVLEGDREAICTHFGTCGGCSLQVLSYPEQLKRKQSTVSQAYSAQSLDVLERILPVLQSKEEFGYRNKMEFTFSDRGWLTSEEIQSGGEFDRRALGLHVPGRFANVVDIKRCYLQSDSADAIRLWVAEYCREHDLPFHNMIEHTGWVRNLVIRSTRQDQLAVLLIVAYEDRSAIDALFTGLQKTFSEIVSFHFILNDKKNSSYSELEPIYWAGGKELVETLGPFSFNISPTAFFQTNPAQAEILYETVFDLLKAQLPDDQPMYSTVYDLYCGTGSIGIFISSLAAQIVGIEYNQASIDDAKKNALQNNIENCSYYAGDMQHVLTAELVDKEGAPEAMVIDPPRSGMHPKVVLKVLQIKPPVIVYVSCNPKTQAVDLASMLDDYELISVQPVDMFPQTEHVESVALLLRKG